MWEPTGSSGRPFAARTRQALGRRLDIGYLLHRLHRMHPVRKALTVIILLGVLALPALGAASAFQDYQQLRTLGQDAIHHLLNAKDAVVPPKTSSSSSSCSTTASATPSGTPSTTPSGTPAAHPTAAPTAAPTPTPSSGGSGGGSSLPDAAHLATAQRELESAQQEFRQLAILLDQPNPTLAFAGNVPSLGTKVTTVRQLVYVGDDVATMGLNLLVAATPLITRLHAGALTATNQPLITPAEAAQLRTAMLASTSLLTDVEARISDIDPNQLPVSACERAEYVHLTSYLPAISGLLAEAPQLFDAAMYFAGVGQPRQFLIQTMDTTELRPTGGFTGQYAVVVTNGGRVQVSALHDVDRLDYHEWCGSCGHTPPTIYDWWPFPNWGLRDSNLSPDFPTTAHLVMGLWKTENIPGYLAQNDAVQLANPNLDGVIAITPTPPAQILNVTGPIYVPQFGETVTGANLINIIHHYQNDPDAIARENAICPATSDGPLGTRRKCFTQTLERLIIARLRSLSLNQIEGIGKLLLQDMKSKEIQIYVTNPQIEAELNTYSYASELTTAPGQDSLMIDQANVSVSKNTPYISMTMSDNVTLDAHGGATHHFAMTFVNNVGSHFVDGFTTFRDYVRIYVPAQAQLLDANGFDTGNPVCWTAPPWHPGEGEPARFAALPICNTGSGFFPDGSLSCPPGYWGPGPRSFDSFGGDGHTDMPVEDTGWPPNMTSDVTGRAMFGGFINLPNMCTSRLTLTWYVPNVALPSKAVGTSGAGYTLNLERQLSTNINVTIKITPSSSVSTMVNQSVNYHGSLTQTQVFTIPRVSNRTGR